MHSFNLDKVNLSKPGQQFNLKKDERSDGFGDIIVNLNWNRGTQPVKAGFFKRLLSGVELVPAPPIDLDLGCLFELKDGTRSGVQALGENFGSFDSPPYIHLLGDDRSGDHTNGETIRINGRVWASKIKRVLVHAHIYDGVANWAQTDAVVTITTANQPPVEVRLTDGRNDRSICAIALLENKGGDFNITREVKYFTDHRDMDKGFAWNLNWREGSK